MRRIFLLSISLTTLALPGCIARTALDLVTAPVKIASGAVDMATTSGKEKDAKMVRAQRLQKEEIAKLETRYTDERGKCMAGDQNACLSARATYQDIQRMLGAAENAPQSRTN